MKIDENIIIRCKSQTEVCTCLDMLKDLGFETFYEKNDYELFVAVILNNLFTNFEAVEVGSKNNFISFKTFQKLYNKQIEERRPDLVVDKNRKILKVNNLDKEYDIFVHSSYDDCVEEYLFDGDYIAKHLNTVDYYTSREACEKALKRKEIENKLRMVAETLNNQVKHMYSLFETNIPKYSISIEYTRFLETKLRCYMCGNNFIQHQGTIYCLDENFLNKAIELIGEEDLKDYLINC